MNLSLASEAVHLNNRELAVYHLQIVTELILDVEGVIYGDISVDQYDSDEEEDNYNYNCNAEYDEEDY